MISKNHDSSGVWKKFSGNKCSLTLFGFEERNRGNRNGEEISWEKRKVRNELNV